MYTVQRLWITANNVKKLLCNAAFEIALQMGTELNNIKDTIINISADARKLSLALRPGILDNLGLVPAIRWLVYELNNESLIKAELSLLNEQNNKLDNERGIHLFRITQEALSNMRRHSEATRVVVTLEFNQEITRMKIWDNGKGFLFRDLNVHST